MTPQQRPLVGISSCLLGNPVRYDGGHKHQSSLIDTLSPFVEWLPFCPEVEAGLGVPRVPVQLIANDGGVRAQNRAENIDCTESLQQVADNFWQSDRQPSLCGYIFKSRSPSCGLGSTPVYGTDGHQQSLISGLFARRARTVKNESERALALVEESWFTHDDHYWLFLTACYFVFCQHSRWPGKALSLYQALFDRKPQASAINADIDKLLGQEPDPIRVNRVRRFWLN